MLFITTKLRRIKIIRTCADVLLFVPRLPLLILHYLGKGAEWINGVIVDSYHKFEKSIVRKFKLDDVAREQYKKNPGKFK